MEASVDKDNVSIQGLRLFGSVTYANSRTLKDPTWPARTRSQNSQTPGRTAGALRARLAGHGRLHLQAGRQIGPGRSPDAIAAKCFPRRQHRRRSARLWRLRQDVSSSTPRFTMRPPRTSRSTSASTTSSTNNISCSTRSPAEPMHGRQISVLKPIRERRPVMRTPVVAALLVMALGARAAYAHAHLDHAVPAISERLDHYGADRGFPVLHAESRVERSQRHRH